MACIDDGVLAPLAQWQSSSLITAPSGVNTSLCLETFKVHRVNCWEP